MKDVVLVSYGCIINYYKLRNLKLLFIVSNFWR